MIRIELPGEPVAKGRPRIAMVRGKAHAYTPAKTVEYEGQLARAARQVMGVSDPLDGPLIVTVFAQFAIAKSRQKGKDAISEGQWHTSRPDADNVLKTLDGLNGIVWRDDCQIAAATVVKTYGSNPRLVIEVKAA